MFGEKSNKVIMKNIFNLPNHYHRVKTFHSRYERFLMPTFLLLGFFSDYIVFANIEISTVLIFLSIYWVIAGVSIIIKTLYESGRLVFASRPIQLITSLSTQFSFGALLSGSMVFYWFSGALSISWPFIVIIALLMFFNDIFKEYFSKPIVQISLYFFITFSFFTLALPFLFNSISAWIFVTAGFLSLVVFFPYTILLSSINGLIQQNKKSIFTSIIIIFSVINVLYFTNIIPPIPLSVREAGAYHNISISRGVYTMTSETETFWQKLIPGQVVHLQVGETLYFYSAIFAPVKLKTTIIHHTQYYNETTKKWDDIAKSSFDIVGGRQQGYKGYSWIENPKPGKWRLYIKTKRGQVLGGMSLTVKRTVEPIETQEVIR